VGKQHSFSFLTFFQLSNPLIVNTCCEEFPHDLLNRKHGIQMVVSLSNEYSSHEGNNLNHGG
jgi:hypothetical protein